jgi:hypothetical protein
VLIKELNGGYSLAIKAKPDYYNVKGWAMDLKTTNEPAYSDFRRDFFKYCYHVQCAWYMDLIKALKGVAVSEFYLLALQNCEPYLPALYKVSDQSLENGRIEYIKKLQSFVRGIVHGFVGHKNDVILEL